MTGAAPGGRPGLLLPYGRDAVLVEVADTAAAVMLYRRLTGDRPAGVVDIVPAARTVLVMADPGVLPIAAARSWIGRTLAQLPAHPAARGTDAGSAPSTAPLEIPVRYDGPDLADVARLLGVGADEVVRRHTSTVWTVAFCGFAPGFGYLVTDDQLLHVPRRPVPRASVPAGAVALAGEYSGVYPRPSPGGWQLIGTTEVTLWDDAADPPALLTPATTVRFSEITR